MGGKKFELYEGVKYEEFFRISPFRKHIHNCFALRQKFRKEHDDLMQNLVKICFEWPIRSSNTQRFFLL